MNTAPPSERVYQDGSHTTSKQCTMTLKEAAHGVRATT